MSAQLVFRDLTLGYDRHPAVHHLDGAVKTGALMAVVGPSGQIHAVQGRGRRH
jgi:zinc/manganese transport system ATP-binding protein